MTPETALDITQWVVSEGLKGSSETEILTGFCQRLVTEGMPLLRANLGFRGVAVPAGEHTIEMRYQPASLRQGFWLAGLAAFAGAAALAVARRRRPG